jgi:hypothetical protein
MVFYMSPILKNQETMLRREDKDRTNEEWHYSSPALAMTGDKIHTLVRMVNYIVKPGGSYIIPGDGSIKTRYTWYDDFDSEGIMLEEDGGKLNRTDGWVMGVEDLRLANVNGKYHVLGTSWEYATEWNHLQMVSGTLDREASILNFDTVRRLSREHSTFTAFRGDLLTLLITPQVYPSPYGHRVEKNWVLFEKDNEPWVVYGWHPLEIGKLKKDGTFQQLHVADTPRCFKELRGSGSGVWYKGQLWFVVHGVIYIWDSVNSWWDRIYYHRMVVMNSDFQIQWYSTAFTFEQSYNIEYTLGMAIKDDNAYIGYSIRDNCAVVRKIPMWELLALRAPMGPSVHKPPKEEKKEA